MPFYDFLCEGCGHRWDEFEKIADREKPLKRECPNCSKKGQIIQQYSGAPAIGNAMRMGLDKGHADSRWTDILKHVQKCHPHGEVHIR